MQFSYKILNHNKFSAQNLIIKYLCFFFFRTESVDARAFYIVISFLHLMMLLAFFYYIHMRKREYDMKTRINKMKKNINVHYFL